MIVKNISIIVLDDNVATSGLKNDWGWSAYIDLGDKAILFDSGTRPDVIEYNVGKLDVDLGKVAFAFLSHYHGDHYGGFKYIGNIRPGLKIYVPLGNANILRKFGLEPDVIESPRMLMDDVWSSGCLQKLFPRIKEHALGIKIENVGIVIVVGCSHPGVDKIAERMKEITGEEIFYVVGGYHNPSRSTLDKLAKISRYMSPAHCSGDRARQYAKTKYPEKYIEIRTGTHIQIGQEGIKITNYEPS